MEITLYGAVGFVFTCVVGGLTIAIMLMGAWVAINSALFDFLLKRSLIYLQLYHRFALFLYAYQRLKARKRKRYELSKSKY